MTTVADAVSLTTLLTYAIPLALTCYDTKYFIIFIAVVATNLSTEAIKPLFKSPRPALATKCDLFCVGGSIGGEPGFPSGHMSTTTVLVALLYVFFPFMYILIGGGIWLGAMAWSRYVKHCHTPTQILGGTAYGLLIAFVIQFGIVAK